MKRPSRGRNGLKRHRAVSCLVLSLLPHHAAGWMPRGRAAKVTQLFTALDESPIAVADTSNEQPDAAAQIAARLEAAWQGTLDAGAGVGSTEPVSSSSSPPPPSATAGVRLRDILAQNCRWDGDTESVGGAGIVEQRVQAIGAFYGNPKFSITKCVVLDDDDEQRSAESNDGPVTPPESNDDALLFGILPNPFAASSSSPSSSSSSKRSKKGAFLVEWTFSGTWPLPWRPRLRISGECLVTATLQEKNPGGASEEGSSGAGAEWSVLALEDRWIAPRDFGGALRDQLLPRAADLLNVYSTPHAEFPEWTRVDRRRGYDIYEAPASLALQATLVVDPGVRPELDGERMQGYFLPDHAFNGQLRWQGKEGEDFIATSPLTVSVEALPPAETERDDAAGNGGEEETEEGGGGSVESSTARSANARRLTWTIPVPSELCTGLDWEKAGLPPAPGRFAPGTYAPSAAAARTLRVPRWNDECAADDAEPNEASLSYAAQPPRRVAVKAFGTADTISDEASAARRELLEALAGDGERVRLSEESGRPLFQLLQNTVKLGWSTEAKTFCMAIYNNSPGASWKKPHFIAAELLPFEEKNKKGGGFLGF